MRAFTQACGLPDLPGKPPLGGVILSHDIVEAALLVRRGWRVQMAADLGGSYEEAPPTLWHFWRRDRRWCQGNMQHLRLLFKKGWHWMSRLHFLDGAMMYLSGLLWVLLLILLGVWLANAPSTLKWDAVSPLLVLTGLLLFFPKLCGLVYTLASRQRVMNYAGYGRFMVSWFAEALFALLLAPVSLLQHSTMILAILLGKDSNWKRQDRRGQSLSARQALGQSILPLGFCLVCVVASALFFTPDILWLYAPLLISWGAAPLLVWGTARCVTDSKKWLSIPEEIQTPHIIDRADAYAQRLASLMPENSIEAFYSNPSFALLHRILLMQSEVAKALPLKKKVSGTSPVSAHGTDKALYALLHDPNYMETVRKKAILQSLSAGKVENATFLQEALKAYARHDQPEQPPLPVKLAMHRR
jgi:membrane glycosyltransferase